MHENETFMHENENFVPGLIFSVHNFMHGVFTHEKYWAKFSFSLMKISFSHMNISFSCMKPLVRGYSGFLHYFQLA